jgi:hypothetical protein
MKQIAIALAPSLAFVNSAQAGNNLPEVQVIKTENQRRQFRRVAVNHTDTKIAVSGRMHALIAETSTDYSPRLLTRRASRKGGIRFSAKLPVLPDETRIKVALHRDKPRQQQNPVHNQTIER